MKLLAAIVDDKDYVDQVRIRFDRVTHPWVTVSFRRPEKNCVSHVLTFHSHPPAQLKRYRYKELRATIVNLISPKYTSKKFYLTAYRLYNAQFCAR